MYRIVHTSDWHLGQSFYNYPRVAEHEAFLSWLLDCLSEQQPDALLITGDIFDTANPPAYAIAWLSGSTMASGW